MQKKHFVVMAREPRVMEQGLRLGDKTIDFHGKSGKTITDPGVADEIDKTYGLKGSGEVWVERDERMNSQANYHEGGIHHYFFGPNRRYSQEYERIFGKKENKDASDSLEDRKTPKARSARNNQEAA